MSALYATPFEDRSEWLAWRREGIGGSDVAALCGLSRFASPMSVYVDKLEIGAEREPSEAMLWGQILEEPISRQVEERIGLFVVGAQTPVLDVSHPWRRCTLDGFVVEALTSPFESALGTCQIKCASSWGWDEVPDEYAVQVQWELGVAELERVWLAVLHQGNHLVIYEIDADPRVYAALCSIVDRFWHERVQLHSPPPADGSDATTEALKAAFADGQDDPVELSDELIETAKALPLAKARVKDAEAELERVENELRLALANSPVGGVRDPNTGEIEPLVTWKPQSAGARLDTKRLKAERPEIAREYTPPAGTTRVLRTTKTLTALIEGEAKQGANA